MLTSSTKVSRAAKEPKRHFLEKPERNASILVRCTDEQRWLVKEVAQGRRRTVQQYLEDLLIADIGPRYELAAVTQGQR